MQSRHNGAGGISKIRHRKPLRNKSSGDRDQHGRSHGLAVTRFLSLAQCPQRSSIRDAVFTPDPDSEY